MHPSTGFPQRRLFVVGSFVEAHCWRVPQIPGIDESRLAGAYTRECGGKGLAVALGAHRLGTAVDVLVAAGTDVAGDALLDLLQREGLGTEHVHRLGAYSGQGCGLTGPQGETTVTVFPGANGLLGERELQMADAALRQAALVYAQLEAPLPLVSAALLAAHASGCTTVLNPSPWPAQAHAEQDPDWVALRHATQVLVLNRAEAARCLNINVSAVALSWEALPGAVLAQFWCGWPAASWLVITLGAQGCVAYGADGSHLRVAGHAVTAVQPIGAGDAFSAGLCAARVDGLPMDQALRTANACGALAASRDGILAALPRREEVGALKRDAVLGGFSDEL